MTHWPALRDAVQPKQLPRVSGQFAFKVAAEWEQLVQRVDSGAFRLRSPASTTRRLCGPFQGYGDCLAPVMENERSWIDPTMPAEDGDFVIVQWHPDTLRGIIERGRQNPKWLAMYGDRPPDIAGKWLRRIGNDYWLVCKDSMLPLKAHPSWGGENRILGVVRFTEQGGVPLYGCGPVALHNIGQNAATETFYATYAGPTAFTSNDELATVSTVISVEPTAMQFTCSFEAMFTSTTVFGEIGTLVVEVNSVQTYVAVARALPGGEWQSFTVQLEAIIDPGDAVDAYLWITPDGEEITVQNVQMRGEMIKR